MKKLIPIAALLFFSCTNKDAEKITGFKLTGTYKNAADQKVYMEQIDPATRRITAIDTAELKEGKFTLEAPAAEQGLYRLRMDDTSMFVFINDAKTITFTGDKNNQTLTGSFFDGTGNNLLKKFILDIDLMNKTFNEESAAFEQMNKSSGNENAKKDKIQALAGIQNNFKNYVKSVVDSSSNPVVALYALDFAQNMNPADFENSVRNLAAKFPEHTGVINYVKAFNAMLAQFKKEQQPGQQIQKATGMPGVGDIAPDFTMNDVNGKPVSLSSFKGKYVLVDFWASWCGPCRRENPAVVAAYNKFKNKNFTILGVSLDEKKENWVKAIADDKLEWTQISDLLYWNSKAVELYKFGEMGIPYNILLDPQGKIIATGLRGSALENKLAEVLK